MGVRKKRDTDGVYVWSCKLYGTTQGTAVFANKEAARSWIEDTPGNGQWVDDGPGDRYDSGADRGVIDMCSIPDADALIVVNPPGNN